MKTYSFSRIKRSAEYRIVKYLKKVSEKVYRKVLPKISKSIYSEYAIDVNTNIDKNDSNDGYFSIISKLPENPTIYSIGIGSNINYGIDMTKKCDAKVFGFDPTDQSAKFVEEEETPERYSFFNFAISEEDGEVKMDHLKPPSETYLAGTVLNIEEESTGNEVIKSRRLSSVMDNLGHRQIDMLKIDAEGAEYGIIKSLIEDGIFPGQIALEFHPHILNFQEGRGMLRLHGWKATAQSISQLKEAGYLLCHQSNRGTEFLFAHERLFKK